jgi:osmotically-inducible protein OsmY
MDKNRKLWQAALAVSVSSALAFPAFVHGQSGTSGLSGAKSVHSSSKMGAGSPEDEQKVSETNEAPNAKSIPSSSHRSAGSSEHEQKANETSEAPNAKSIPSSSHRSAGSSEHGQKAVGGKSVSRIRHNLAPNEFFTQADRDLVKRVQETLRTDSSRAVSAQKIDITAKQGKVVLRGAVKDDQEKVAIATEVQRTMGVERVENQLQVSGGLSSRESTSSSSTDTMHRSDSGGMGSSGNTISR